MDRAARKVLPIIRNGKCGRLRASSRRRLPAAPLLALQPLKKGQRGKPSFHILKPANTSRLSLASPKRNRYCKLNGNNWKIRRLPAMAHVCWLRIPRWKMLNIRSMSFMRAGASWKRRRGEKKRLAVGQVAEGLTSFTVKVPIGKNPRPSEALDGAPGNSLPLSSRRRASRQSKGDERFSLRAGVFFEFFQ